MAAHHIYAEQTVSISELRKNPARFFGEEPVAVLSNNKPTGYLLGAGLYEELLQLLEESQKTSDSRFRPTKSRLNAITRRGEELLLSATKEELNTFRK